MVLRIFFQGSGKTQKKSGFTLIELLIVIAVIAILATVSFVALDPLTRFRDARDVRRSSDIVAILSAIKIDQVDNEGTYLSSIASIPVGQVHMIGTDTTGCNSYNSICDTAVVGASACVDLTGLADEGYVGSVPMSPNGQGTWTSGHTGYTLERSLTGIITVRSCESENTDEIKLSR